MRVVHQGKLDLRSFAWIEFLGTANESDANVGFNECAAVQDRRALRSWPQHDVWPVRSHRHKFWSIGFWKESDTCSHGGDVDLHDAQRKSEGAGGGIIAAGSLSTAGLAGISPELTLRGQRT